MADGLSGHPRRRAGISVVAADVLANYDYVRVSRRCRNGTGRFERPIQPVSHDADVTGGYLLHGTDASRPGKCGHVLRLLKPMRDVTKQI